MTILLKDQTDILS